MTRKTKIALAVSVAAAIAAIQFSRQFVAIGPRVPRERLATMSGLPLPWFLGEAKHHQECTGLICMDFEATVSSPLNPGACKRAADAAPVAGYSPIQRSDSASLGTSRGFKLYRPDPPSGHLYVWLDTERCVLTARYIDT